MASLAEQIADAVYDSLHGQIAAVGTRVYRGRVDPISREECPCINVRLTDETTSNAEIDASTEENELVIVVDVHVADHGGARRGDCLAAQNWALEHH
jgi:hypothetical protein